MGSAVDRFSVIALNSLNRIHDGFTPEELLRVECVPQNKEAAQAGRYLKSNAGRARKFARKRAGELVTEQQSSTIACVSGFLFNMVDSSVKLISPCNASERWPLGYWVIASGHVRLGGRAGDLLRSMLDEHIRDGLSVLDRVRLRRDVRMVVEPDKLQVISPGLGLAFDGQPMAGELAALIADGTNTVEQIALRRRSLRPGRADADAGGARPAVREGLLRRGAAVSRPLRRREPRQLLPRELLPLEVTGPGEPVTTATPQTPAGRVDVCLVAMPYASLTRPSMALGLLAAILERDGITATVAPATCGSPRAPGCSCTSCAHRGCPPCSWRGSGRSPPRPSVMTPNGPGWTPNTCGRSARRASSTLPSGAAPAAGQLVRSSRAAGRGDPVHRRRARRVLATGARVVGCTSTFEQHVASLALLRRIRELDPDVVTMLGGANCETVMGETTHRCFPWVDFVVSGEADGLVSGLCRLALDRPRRRRARRTAARRPGPGPPRRAERRGTG